MANHNKKTHDSLQKRVADELVKRYNYRIEENYMYKRGELDIARLDEHGNVICYYEVKSNDTGNNMMKAYDQTKRFINYQKGTINIDKMENPIRGVYISQDKINGDIKAERLI